MELTNEQREAIDALPRLARRVVLERVKDPVASDVECYRRAGGKARSDSAARNSVHLILTNPNTVNVLAMFDQPVIDEAIATREDLLRDLTTIVNTSVHDVMSWYTPQGNLIDDETGNVLPLPSVITIRNMDDIPSDVMRCIKSIKQTKYGIELTMEDRTAARKLLADMQGFNAPIVTASITKEVKDNDEFLDALNDIGLNA